MRWALAVVLLVALAGCSGQQRPGAVDPRDEAGDTGNAAIPRPGNGATGVGGQGGAGAPATASPPVPTVGGNATELPSFRPHVLVGVPDSGINPYHVQFRRDDLTMHPCTYLEDFPCEVPALNLSIGVHDTWQAAVEADIALWRSIQPGDWFWVPRTVFVAVGCEAARTAASDWGDPICVLDENDSHGTGITSTILHENPDALIVFLESHAQAHGDFDALGAPIDVYSHSNGWNGPSPYVGPTAAVLEGTIHPIYVRAAGNQPDTTFDKWTRAHPDVIAVGGGYAQDRSATVVTTKTIDVASYFCHPAARADHLDATHGEFCGTSAAAPTVAGAVSKVVLRIREASGYTGSIAGRMVDPVAGLSIAALRDAINATASYSPPVQYPITAADYANPVGATMPVPEDAPWTLWGWGFYDGLVANATLDVLNGVVPAPEKPEEAVAFQQAQYAVRAALYG